MTVVWDDLHEGDAGPEPMTFGPITRTQIVQYQGASGDFQPIHHDEPFALEAGYEAPLVVGMLPAGVMQGYLVSWLGPENIRQTKVRFCGQVWPGDMLTVRGEIKKKYVDTENRVDVEVECVNQHAQVVLKGWASFVLPAHSN